MPNHRRRFLQQFLGATGALSLAPFFSTLDGKNLLRGLEDYQHFSADHLATEEEFWRMVRQSYTVSTTIVNLNNGGVSPQPRVVQEAVERYNRLSNEMPSHYMWHILDKGREPLRAKLAKLAGCPTESIAINRNASEALETVIFGLRLQPGDEVVLSNFDYPNMMNAWKQRAHRDKIALKWVELDVPMEDEAEIVDRYVNAFSDRTKVVHLTHLINWTGQVIPVTQIARKAREKGIEVVVDGAHSFAHLNYQIRDLECDYFGTSLHKWLCAPFGSGMLYVRPEKIASLYPLLAAEDPESPDIRKFESLGTRSFAIEHAIGQAIEFHQLIGSERKFKRLHFLQNYWLGQARELPGARAYTSLNPRFAGALANIGFAGKAAGDLRSYLFSKHLIHTVSISWEGVDGVRITPNVYTTLEELDRLMEALKKFSHS